MNKECKHKWVNYQPFQGDEYMCCANAGCGIKFTEWIQQELKTTHPNTIPADEYGWLHGMDSPFLPAGIAPPAEKPKIDCPIKMPPKKGWVPVDYGYYLNGIEMMSPDSDEEISWMVKEYDQTGRLPGDKL